MLNQLTGESVDDRQQQQLQIMTDYGTVQGTANEEADGVEPWRFHAVPTSVSKLDSNNCELQPLTSAHDITTSSSAHNEPALIAMTRQKTQAVAASANQAATDKPCSRFAQRFNAWALRVGPSCLSNADIQKHKKIILISSFFCVFGIILCSTGTALTVRQPEALYNLVFVIGGLVIFIPGIYYLVYIIKAYYGHEGYNFEDLPPMD